MISTAAVGGSRFLLNIRGAYFSSTQNLTSRQTGFSRSALYAKTEGTVGVFHAFTSDVEDECNNGEDHGGGSVEMGIWANTGPKNDRPPAPAPAAITPVSPTRNIQCDCSTSDSSSICPREPDNFDGQAVSSMD